MQEKEKNPLIFQTINNVLKDVTAIGKDKKNTQQGYSFRGIDDLYNELHGLFAKHGLFFTSELVGSLREERTSKSGGATIYSIIDIKFTFYALDGSSVSSVMRGEAMDSGDKASNKAASAALKYALLQLFMIPTEEEKDTEFQSPEVKPKRITIDQNIVDKISKADLDSLGRIYNDLIEEEKKIYFKFFKERKEALLKNQYTHSLSIPIK
jgi:hypothetical protein